MEFVILLQFYFVSSIKIKSYMDLVILKINGQDVSKANQQDALEAFRSAKEPIVVEVRRRQHHHPHQTQPNCDHPVEQSCCSRRDMPCTATSTSAPTCRPGSGSGRRNYDGRCRVNDCSTVDMSTVGTQTDEYIEHFYFNLFGHPTASAIAAYGAPLERESRALRLDGNGAVYLTSDLEMPATLDYDEQLLGSFEQELDVQYEEVEVHRTYKLEKLGLTLCYGAAAYSQITDVFVGEIEPGSIAEQSGCIHEGDQILQINGREVHSREEAIQLFAQDRDTIALLLARPNPSQFENVNVDDRFAMEDGLDILQEYDDNLDNISEILEQEFDGEEVIGSGAVEVSLGRLDKDSGIGQTDDSRRYDESSEQEFLEQNCPSSIRTVLPPSDKRNKGPTNDQKRRGSSPLSQRTTKLTAKLEACQGSSLTSSPCPSRKSTDFVTKNQALPISSGLYISSPPANESLPMVPQRSLVCRDSQKTVANSSSPLLKRSSGNMEREIALINKEMEQIKMECRELVELQKNKSALSGCSKAVDGGDNSVPPQRRLITTEQQHLQQQQFFKSSRQHNVEPYCSPRMVPKMGTRMDYIRHWQCLMPEEEEFLVVSTSTAPKDERSKLEGIVPPSPSMRLAPPATSSSFSPLKTAVNAGPGEVENDTTSNSSAYHTEESCRSTPLTLQLHHHDPPESEEANGLGGGGSLLSLSCSGSVAVPMSSPQQRRETVQRSSCLVSRQGHERAISHQLSNNTSNGEKLYQHQQLKLKQLKQEAVPEVGEKEGESAEHCSNDGMLPKSRSSSSVSKISQTEDGNGNHRRQSGPTPSLKDLYVQYADVMYTNSTNLQHTIMVQQRLFQQQLAQRARLKSCSVTSKCKDSADASPLQEETQENCAEPQASHRKQELGVTSGTVNLGQGTNEANCLPSSGEGVSGGSGDPSSLITGGGEECTRGGIQMEWVVKRRADGTRYITRRPIRNKLLRERAKKIAEERAGLTTDDDAISEMKVGRYWNKGERKRHMEKSRDHKQRKREIVLMQKQKLATATTNAKNELGGGGAKEGLASVEGTSEEVTLTGPGMKKELNIVELGHRKMIRHKRKQVLDNFVTLEEMLVHGSREYQTATTTYNPLLSVTTV